MALLELGMRCRIRTALSSLAALTVCTGCYLASSGPAEAYKLYSEDDCNPGRAWDISQPIKVKLLADSYFDYLDVRGTPQTLADLTRIDADIRAVVDLFNAIPGSGLVLEFDQGITGDRNLESPSNDDFGDQTIVIGFTDASGPPEASATGFNAANDACERVRAHIRFRKSYVDDRGTETTDDDISYPYHWVFGPPDTADVSPRSFVTAAQPAIPKPDGATGNVNSRTFLGILTHEMGHAVGLGHPDDDYAIMGQAFATWFRGEDNVLRTQLLPDDMAGVLALYGTSNVRTHLDVSVTNSWYRPKDDPYFCQDEVAALARAETAEAEIAAVVDKLQGVGGDVIREQLEALEEETAQARIALNQCTPDNAMQRENCRVSSRSDNWADRELGSVLCGVARTSGSAFPPVTSTVCPGAQVQARYTLNNNSMFRDALVKAEMWFSRDTGLNAFDGQDQRSDDVREFMLDAGRSATIGQVFRLPANAPAGETLRVFVRAVPYDPDTGQSLWRSDADRWNNAMMLRSSIQVSASPSC